MENKDEVYYESKKKARIRASNFAFLLIIFSAFMAGAVAKDCGVGVTVLFALCAIAVLIKLAIEEIIEAIEKEKT